ncbi:MAG: serine protease [Pseudomonadota bacterium]
MADALYSAIPTFKSTPTDDVIGQFTLQLVTERDDIVHTMGTAVWIGPSLAITAAHIMDACKQAYGLKDDGAADFLMHAIQYGPSAPVNFSVQKIFRSNLTDIALLHLRADAESIPELYPRISLIPPKKGERIVAFGYPAKLECTALEVVVTPNGSTSVGVVREVYMARRDLVMAPFSCFETNQRFDDSMSGGPVFNNVGELCGLICSTFEPSSSEEAYVSYCTLLWPLVDLEIDVQFADQPELGASYKFIEFLKFRGDGVVGLDRIQFAKGQIIYCSPPIDYSWRWGRKGST